MLNAIGMTVPDAVVLTILCGPLLFLVVAGIGLAIQEAIDDARHRRKMNAANAAYWAERNA